MSDSRPQERPPAFTYSRNESSRPSSPRELFADEVPLRQLAERYGTPLYVYSATTIRQRYQQFDEAFCDCEHTLCYSVKANSNLSILKLLASLGSGFDIVSGGELQRVLQASRKSLSQVVFSGVGKLPEEIDLALRSGILLFNVESAAELQMLGARATHLRKTAKFAIRVNPDVDARTHPYISTGLREHK
ncbi:MAG TPA: diaminopimelate decarboxylase, partial [Terriglobales bacterium]